MYKFSKLFIKNIFFASVFIIILSSIAFFVLSNYVTQQTLAQQKTIQTISQQFVDNDIPVKELTAKLSAILNAKNDYQTLIIKRDSSILFDYQNNYIHPLDSFVGQRKTVSVSELNLQVQYQLNFIDVINLLTQLFIGVIASVSYTHLTLPTTPYV